MHYENDHPNLQVDTRVVKILENGALDLASKFEGFSRVTLEKSSNFWVALNLN